MTAAAFADDRVQATDTCRSRSGVLAQLLAAQHSRSKRGGPRSGTQGSAQESGLFTDRDLERIEGEHESGMTAVQIVELFHGRGVRFSEATFRKYVQQGLLPRSRRIGRKGKHRGSLGVYPAKTVRRINAIKQLMGEGYTIEEIQERFLRYSNLIESLEDGLSDLFDGFESDLEAERVAASDRKSFGQELREARKTADLLMERINGLSRKAQEGHGDTYGPTGAAGSAEDLL